MSHPIIDRSPDLKRLRDEGYEVQVKAPQGCYLLIGSVPYVTSAKTIRRGTLVCELSVSGGVTTKPSTHVAHFIGEFPCKPDGSEVGFKHPNGKQAVGDGIANDHSFSLKRTGTDGYANYYDKVVTYVGMIESPARAIDPNVTAKTFRAIPTSEGESPFKYFDTATSRAGIGVAGAKLAVPKVGILGVGGTGSYVLDFLAKTPIGEIHLFDGDTFFNHNAFRAPGAASIEELETQPKKAAYFAARYSQMRWRIIPHVTDITSATVDLLREMSFVFICIDGGPAKKLIVDHLEQWNIPFIDVGMGVQLVDEKLRGALSVALSNPQTREMVRKKISFVDTAIENEYDRNIQIVELNALNAALAVIKWKKCCGFYHDFQDEHFTSYTIDGNILLNEGKP
jgi:hypothetical protein